MGYARDWDTEGTGDLDESHDWQRPHRNPNTATVSTPTDIVQARVLDGDDPIERQWPSADYPDNWDIYNDRQKKG